MKRHLISPTCDPQWCKRPDPVPASLDIDGRWQLHQWHPTAHEDDGIETACGHGGVRITLTFWNIAWALDDGVTSTRCEHCWTDETWAALLRLVDAETAISPVPAVTS
jgi:hypothetical protein